MTTRQPITVLSLLLVMFLGLMQDKSALAQTADAKTVYITKTGEKYHKSTCQYLKYSKFTIDLSDAIDRGYAACKVCKPSKGNVVNSNNNLNNNFNSNGSNKLNSTNNVVVPSKNATASRCTSKTQAGARCKRMTKNTSGKCWQHED